MTEIKLTIEAPAIVEALTRIATLLEMMAHNSVSLDFNAPAAQPVLEVSAPAAVPTQPGAPLQAATPVAQVPPPAPVPPAAAPISAVPVAAPVEYTLQQLSLAATPLMDAGKQPQLIAALQKYGVVALTQLPKEQYGAFAAELRAMGARI